MLTKKHLPKMANFKSRHAINMNYMPKKKRLLREIAV